MMREATDLRIGEVWVDCAACDLAYKNAKADKNKWRSFKTSSLGSGQLARIRGKSKNYSKRFARINKVNLETFAIACGVDKVTLLANGTGLALPKGEIKKIKQAVESLVVYSEVAKDRAAAPQANTSNISIGVPTYFMGRDETPLQISSAFTNGKGRAIIALHGLRGVGKSSLAAAYAEQTIHQYQATWWIRADSSETIQSDIVNLGIQLNWVSSDWQREAAVAEVKARLRNSSASILLIFDNAPNPALIKTHMRLGRSVHVLITSTAPTWRSMATPIEVETWTKEVGTDYLVARTGLTAEREAGEALSEALGGLPLAHEQAAAYCERLSVSFAEYHKRFEAVPAKLLDDAHHAPDDYYGGRTVAKTFTLAIDEASRLHTGAKKLISLASLVDASEALPLFLFSARNRRSPSKNFILFDDESLEEAVAALRSFALLKRVALVDARNASMKVDGIAIHRLVRHVAVSRCSEAEKDRLARLMLDALAYSYPQDTYNHPKTWPRARALNGLALFLLERSSLAALKNPRTLLAALMDEVGGYHANALADYGRAIAFRRQALSIREALLGKTHTLTAGICNNLALSIKESGDYRSAYPLFRRALRIRRDKFGHNHPSVAVVLNNLGRLLHDMGQLKSAESFIRRALAIRRKSYGQKAILTAQCLNNLGFILHDLQRLDEARPLFECALAIREEKLGEMDPRTATSCNNLANLLVDQGYLSEAVALLYRALKIDTETLGIDHPGTATDFCNLGRALFLSGDPNTAERFYLRAIAIGERTLGPTHPRFQRYRSQYGLFLISSGKYSQALAMAQGALEVHAAKSGKHHPWTRDSARGTSLALELLGRKSEARALRHRFGLERSAGNA